MIYSFHDKITTNPVADNGDCKYGYWCSCPFSQTSSPSITREAERTSAVRPSTMMLSAARAARAASQALRRPAQLPRRAFRELPAAGVMAAERREAAAAEPVRVPWRPSTQKRRPPSRVADLYDALVYDEGGKGRASGWASAVAIDECGDMVSEIENERYRARLVKCRETCDAEGAMGVLRDMKRIGMTPTGRAIVMAIEACVPAEEFLLAEEALAMFSGVAGSHPALGVALQCSARSLVAIAYSSRDRHRDALRVMGFNIHGSDWRNRGNLDATLDAMNLGRDTVAWGAVIRALSKSDKADLALAVVDGAMIRNVGMTDSLLHLTIMALAKTENWKQADWLFDHVVQQGVKPRDRTIASLLYALTGRVGRRHIPPERIIELTKMVSTRSDRFLVSSLNALASVGLVDEATEAFRALAQLQPSGIAQERAYAVLMGVYGNHVELCLPRIENSDIDTTQLYDKLNTAADELWHEYLASYQKRRPDASNRMARVSVLTRYLWAKTRCLRINESVDILSEIQKSPSDWPWLELQHFHLTAVLGAIELSCNTAHLERVLAIMNDAKMLHDMRSLAYTVGTYVADGNPAAAFAAVKASSRQVLSPQALNAGFMQYHVAILLRRLQMLDSALRQSGGGNSKELQQTIEALRNKMGSKAALRGSNRR